MIRYINSHYQVSTGETTKSHKRTHTFNYIVVLDFTGRKFKGLRQIIQKLATVKPLAQPQKM